MIRKQSAATALAAQNRTAAQTGTVPGDAASDSAPGVSMAERTRRSVAGRALAGLVAMTLWLAPLQVSLQQARQAAGVLAAGAVAADAPAVLAGAARQGLMRWAVNHLPVAVSFGMREADAAPIVDPTAPIRFQPTISTTTGPGAPEGGVPVVGITRPNAAGISLNQYRAFVVDPVGLILNNSTTGGGTFLGGQVTANPNLSVSGPASLIINQVTSSAAAQINGTVEIFGGPAGLVIAAPGGVYTSGAGFTNATQVTLTTGVPQFLSTTGAPSSFDAAAAAGFLVEGGRIQIANPAPGNPNGVGIEGTVGNVNLIAESIGIDAALYAGNQINVVAGRQLVAPAGTGFATTATGPNNASTNTTAANGLAIDATAFGAMTAGQISILSTAAGVGVRTDGNLAASAGNLTLDSAGNLKVGKTYGKGDVALSAAGSIDAAGNGQSEGNYTARAGRDATLGGTLSANQAVTVSAGGSINGAGSVTAQQASTLAAGGSVDVGGAVSGSQVTVTAAGNDGKGDIHFGARPDHAERCARHHHRWQCGIGKGPEPDDPAQPDHPRRGGQYRGRCHVDWCDGQRHHDWQRCLARLPERDRRHRCQSRRRGGGERPGTRDSPGRQHQYQRRDRKQCRSDADGRAERDGRRPSAKRRQYYDHRDRRQRYRQRRAGQRWQRDRRGRTGRHRLGQRQQWRQHDDPGHR